ncbi:MAG: tetratricopeptide repeat protein, partial [Acidobacteria bacterium]|nr:tetratricopeptide repeat protein [Acidobacteriota bacterium]
GELADDLQRWLDGEPVRARPSSFGYRVRRFVGRHRGGVVAAAAAILALVLLAAFSTFQSLKALRAEERAREEERKAKAVVGLLLETFGATDPYGGAVGDEVKISDLLDQGEARAEGLSGQADVQAALRSALGRIRLERGDFSGALRLLEAAREAEISRLGNDSAATVELRLSHARALHATGRRDEAEEELEDCLAILEALPAPDPELLAGVLQGLGATLPGQEGAAMLERAAGLLRGLEGGDLILLGDILSSLAVHRSMSGDREAGVRLLKEAMPLFEAQGGESSPRALAVRSNLANLLDDPAARESEHRVILELRRKRLGDRSLPVANSWSHLGLALSELGRHEEAEAAFRSSLAIWSELAGPTYRLTLEALRGLARSLARQGRLEEASEAFAELESRLPEAHLDQATAQAFRAEGAELRSRLQGETQAN